MKNFAKILGLSVLLISFGSISFASQIVDQDLMDEGPDLMDEIIDLGFENDYGQGVPEGERIEDLSFQDMDEIGLPEEMIRRYHQQNDDTYRKNKGNDKFDLTVSPKISPERDNFGRSPSPDVSLQKGRVFGRRTSPDISQQQNGNINVIGVSDDGIYFRPERVVFRGVGIYDTEGNFLGLTTFNEESDEQYGDDQNYENGDTFDQDPEYLLDHNGNGPDYEYVSDDGYAIDDIRYDDPDYYSQDEANPRGKHEN